MTARQLDPSWRPDSATLEQHLKALREAPLSAQVLRSLQLTTLRLRETNRLMNRVLAEAACPMINDAQTKELTHYRDDQLRPYLENLTHLADAWLGAVDTLFDAQRVSRATIEAYRQDWLSLNNPEAPWQRFQDARHSHRQHWARLMRRCNDDAQT